MRILFESALYDALSSEAKARGTMAPKLARLLLVTVLSDNLVAAILDVPVGKGRPLKRTKRKATVKQRRTTIAPLPQSTSTLSSPMVCGRMG